MAQAEHGKHNSDEASRVEGPVLWIGLTPPARAKPAVRDLLSPPASDAATEEVAPRGWLQWFCDGVEMEASLNSPYSNRG